MVARALNVPHLASTTASFKVNGAGRLKLFESGTNTPKVAYKDAAKATSYGSVIDLNSAGQPDDGVIFWDGLYKVEVYENQGGTYSFMYSVDPWGDIGSTVITTQNGTEPLNGSFESEDDDSLPIYWDITDSASVVSLDTIDPWHGGKCLKFTSSSNGSDYATSNMYTVSEDKILYVEFAIKANNAASNPQIKVLWFDKDQTSVSTSTIYDSDQSSTPTSWEDIPAISVAVPATATFYKLQLIGNAGATQYTACFDDVRVYQKFKFQTPSPRKPEGFLLSRSGTDSDHDIVVSEGSVKADDGVTDIILQAATTKKFDAGFTKGTGNGGGESGFSLPASGHYAVWAIHSTTTGEVDILASNSYTAPNMPSGFNSKRLIGYVTTDSSNNNVPFIHTDNIFYQLAITKDVEDTSLTSGTAETGTFSAPPNSIAFLNFWFNIGGSDQTVDIGIHMGPTGAGVNGMDTFRTDLKSGSSATMDEVNAMFQIYLDDSSQADYAVTNGTTNALTATGTIWTKGCIMLSRDNL